MLIYTVSMPEKEDEQKFILSMYEEYKYIMFKTAGEFEEDSDAAKDLVHDALLKLIENVLTLMEMKRPQLVTYIVHTIKNTAIDKQRRMSVRDRYIDDQELTEDTVPSGQQQEERPLEDKVLSSLAISELQSILKSLPERTQVLLRGKYQFSLDDAELARLIGCRPGSIRMMLTRARRQALELLEKEGFNEIT